MEEVKAELSHGRRCQVFAVYTQKRDVTQRLKNILSREGIRVEVLTTAVPPEAREAWYERQLKAGMQVCVAHPKLVATGLDYVEYEAATPEPLSIETSVFFADSEISESAGAKPVACRTGKCGFPIGAGRHSGGS